MIKQCIRQAVYMLKKNPLVSFVSILGTALSIALVMVVVILFQIRVANIQPEVNRNRTLFLTRMVAESCTDEHRRYGGQASYEAVENYFYSMKTPALTAVYSYPAITRLSTLTKELPGEYLLKGTDLNYWRYFEFRFLEGSPFDEGEYYSGLQIAVITKKVAQALFKEELAVGKEIYVNEQPYRIAGVVEDVSRAAAEAFAHIWIPVTSDEDMLEADAGGIIGSLSVCFLAEKRKDRERIREEFEQVIKRMNDENKEYVITEIELFDHIDKEFFLELRDLGMWGYLLSNLLTILFLLLLPAINLTGVAMNNIKERSSEIGIRKAFGAGRGVLLWQVLMENLVITAIGAVGGYLLSFAFVYIGSDFLIDPDTLITADMLLQPFGFFCAVLFAFLINLMSAGLPAWKISRRSITDSLSKHEF